MINQQGSLRKFIPLASIAIGVIIAFLPAPEGLTRVSMLNLGAMAWAIINWASHALPDFVVAMLLVVFWLVVLHLPSSVVLAPFSSTTEWLLLSSLVFVVALEKTGLAKRIANFCLRLFPKSYSGRVLALVLCGIIFGPIIPDAIAKITMFGPIALEIGERAGYRPKSKNMTGLTLGAWVGIMPLGSVLFKTGSAVNLAVFASLGSMGSDITWLRWFVAALPLILFEGVILVLCLLHFSDNKSVENTDPPETESGDKTQNAKMNLREGITATVLGTCVVLWATESFHHIEAAWVALAGVALLFVFDVIDRHDFTSKVDWALWVYVSFIMCIGSVFSELGINKAIGRMLAPGFNAIGANQTIFLLAVVVLVFIARIVLANSITPAILIVTILAPQALAIGIHPFLLVLVSLSAGSLWPMPYMNPMFMALRSATNDSGFDQYHARLLNWVYMGCTVAGTVICIPWWKFLGLIK